MNRLFEDFVPVSDTRALITTGKGFSSLNCIEAVDYTVEDDRVVFESRGALVTGGRHIRLGGLFDNRLVYSDTGRGIVGAVVASLTAHQPFFHRGDVYYTDDWPLVRIFRNRHMYLGHFDGYVQVGNPHWANGWMYFEARRNPDAARPDTWEVWRRREVDGVLELVCLGANPACWNGWLFHGEWNGKGFDYRRTALD